MPIYLVRWPDLSASLVRARNENELLDHLDQMANPEGCEWSVYKGPLFIDFELPAKWSIKDDKRPSVPLEPSQVVIDDVGPMEHQHIMEAIELSVPLCDEGSGMVEEILRKAFPSVHEAVEKFRSSDEAEERDCLLPEVNLRAALHVELSRLLKASWRGAQIERSTDPLAKFAKEMDMPIALARMYVDAASQEQARGDNDDPEKDGENP